MVIVMRIILSILVLILSLQSWTKADDIRDFEIEGMSIGDSLLEFVTLAEIDKLPESGVGEYKQTLIKTNLETYDTLLVTYKKNDNKYIIEGLTANLRIYSGINNCYKKMSSIENEISSLFSNLTRKNWGILELDKPYQTYNPITYDFENKDRIQIACWDLRISKDKDNDRDLFKFSFFSSDYRNAIKLEAVEK